MKDLVYILCNKKGVIGMSKVEPDVNEKQYLLIVSVKIPDGEFVPHPYKTQRISNFILDVPTRLDEILKLHEQVSGIVKY